MADWGLAENPCIPSALVDDKYFPLLGGDPTLTAGEKRGVWSYDYRSSPSPGLTAQAVKITEWDEKIRVEVKVEATMTMSAIGLEVAVAI